MAYTLGMSVGFTAVFKKVPEGYVAYVEELPARTPRAQRSRRRGRIFARPWNWSSMPTARWPDRRLAELLLKKPDVVVQWLEDAALGHPA